MVRTTPVPHWLLTLLSLQSGKWNPEPVSITGQPNAHLAAVLNTGPGRPTEITIDLTLRDDWPSIKLRLAQDQPKQAH